MLRQQLVRHRQHCALRHFSSCISLLQQANGSNNYLHILLSALHSAQQDASHKPSPMLIHQLYRNIVKQQNWKIPILNYNRQQQAATSNNMLDEDDYPSLFFLPTKSDASKTALLYTTDAKWELAKSNLLHDETSNSTESLPVLRTVPHISVMSQLRTLGIVDEVAINVGGALGDFFIRGDASFALLDYWQRVLHVERALQQQFASTNAKQDAIDIISQFDKFLVLCEPPTKQQPQPHKVQLVYAPKQRQTLPVFTAPDLALQYMVFNNLIDKQVRPIAAKTLFAQVQKSTHVHSLHFNDIQYDGTNSEGQTSLLMSRQQIVDVLIKE